MGIAVLLGLEAIQGPILDGGELPLSPRQEDLKDWGASSILEWLTAVALLLRATM